MTLPAYMYRDPAEVYEQTEARSCKGCVYEKTARLMGTTHTVCTKLLPGGKRRNHGKRCQSYGEKNE
ncbi:hypothetical protein [Cupriavidus sp.]|jgi:hypothetical protein|uniref:hypothetical protein n=1 Tax=Cupriavidus sp. TaxID=1873897 RepID=UPI0025BFFD49|nr:hypothetical protein [Cupriavidus sp.]MCA3186864.1 hypothetical protein [Cupriavidus sp.]MCA3190935.1 hypothetical protein [Cupriavidus sp.]MCA3199279.1 hypothetical protein [Cupriavidus sp.]MCA3204546.1 hypothetical protein [Cupriavidus sp.]MCA3209860.1 hypothetical protein [Cupriavidus sp.]